MSGRQRPRRVVAGVFQSSTLCHLQMIHLIVFQLDRIGWASPSELLSASGRSPHGALIQTAHFFLCLFFLLLLTLSLQSPLISLPGWHALHVLPHFSPHFEFANSNLCMHMHMRVMINYIYAVRTRLDTNSKQKRIRPRIRSRKILCSMGLSAQAGHGASLSFNRSAHHFC